MEKTYSGLNLVERAQKTTVLVKRGLHALQDHQQDTNTLAIDYIEGVAMARYSISVIAEVLKSGEKNEHFHELFIAAKQMCTDVNVNHVNPSSHISGPVIYLIKIIARQFGMPCLKEASENYPWIIPSALKGREVSNCCCMVLCLLQ